MTDAQKTLRSHASTAIQTASEASQKQKAASTLSIIKTFIDKDDVKRRFSDIVGKKAPAFLSSITSLVSSSTNFDGVDPNTIMAAALVAATLDLPINQNLGFAYIIPYNGRDGNKAQFQMGYKGFIQLALRSGDYKAINATEVYEGELIGINRLTGEIKLDEKGKKSDKIIGYAAYFSLLNGFEKAVYMTVEDITNHAKKFSKSYNKENSIWKKDFHSMALKTVLKLILSKYGILSTEMQKAVEVDQAVIKQDNSLEYVDAFDERSLKEIADKSKAKKEVFSKELSETGNIESLDLSMKEIQDTYSSGELTEEDFLELTKQYNEKKKTL